MVEETAEVEEPKQDSDGVRIREMVEELEARCKAANFPFTRDTGFDEEDIYKVEIPSGRKSRSIWLSDQSIVDFLSFPFEEYVYVSGFDAICSYKQDIIECAVRPVGPMNPMFAYRKIFGLDRRSSSSDLANIHISLPAPQDGLPKISLGGASEEFLRLASGLISPRVTLTLLNSGVKTHDQAVQTLKRAADALFFQIDLMADVSLSLVRQRSRFGGFRQTKREFNVAEDLEYPRHEFDEAPASLYWYGRSAAGMPLLQFLAFYQTIEFYFPTYAEADARRRLRTVLKDPTFRGERDADIGRLLAAVSVNRSGAFGDERSQLRATILECVDADALRRFLESDQEMADFYSGKAKSPYHKIPLANPTVDLRSDVADRIYNIRCRIVHTKHDSRDGEVELLLPYSQEAEQLTFDIELVRYVAQRILIATSTPFK